METSVFHGWLRAYGYAWETHDCAAIGLLFAQDALYYIKPFDEPLCGRSAIVQYWEGIARKQINVHFQADVLSITGNTLLAHWTTTFDRVRSGRTIQLDGILLAEVNPAGECVLFKEWWHRQES